MKQALNLKQSQRLTMTPQLQQAVKLLQMNTAELSAELIQAHETNPLLEMEDPSDRDEITHDEDVLDAESSDESRESLDEDWVSSQTYDRIRSSANNFEGTLDIPDNPAAISLKQSLEDQLMLLTLPQGQVLVAELIIEYIDDAGYVDVDLGEICKQANNELNAQSQINVSDVELVLGIIQGFDPIGVGARSPAECLTLQLESMDGDSPVLDYARQLVRDHLPLLANRDYQSLKRKLRLQDEQLKQVIDLIKELNPHPGYSLDNVAVNYVAPDIVVEHHRGVWLARLNTGSLPRVVINKEYQQLVDENSSSKSFAKMKEQLVDAKWLLSNIDKRHSTILSVASQIVERQQSFFEHGPAAMRPMILRDVSEALDIHESTVSRATSGKYMLTPLGMFELKYFFSTEISTSDGVLTSAVAIQSLIKEMIDKEPPSKPISDMKICESLKEAGYEVARRTVAKYREGMNIPSTSKRKSL